MAVLVDAAARPIRRWIGSGRLWALTIAGDASGAVFAFLTCLVGSHLQAQVAALLDQISQAIAAIEQHVGVRGQRLSWFVKLIAVRAMAGCP